MKTRRIYKIDRIKNGIYDEDITLFLDKKKALKEYKKRKGSKMFSTMILDKPYYIFKTIKDIREFLNTQNQKDTKEGKWTKSIWKECLWVW